MCYLILWQTFENLFILKLEVYLQSKVEMRSFQTLESFKVEKYLSGEDRFVELLTRFVQFSWCHSNSQHQTNILSSLILSTLHFNHQCCLWSKFASTLLVLFMIVIDSEFVTLSELVLFSAALAGIIFKQIQIVKINLIFVTY